MMNKKEQTIYDLGYKQGFDDGLNCATKCANCEHITDCPDDSKADYCPYSTLKNQVVSIDKV
jgi:hypothetical protein